MTLLFRNLKTEVVHEVSCMSSGLANCATWHWADDKSMDEVTAATAEFPWLHLCRLCLPGKCRCRRCAS